MNMFGIEGQSVSQTIMKDALVVVDAVGDSSC
jgi:hypothetical protein